MYSYIFKQALLVDGTGTKPVVADVAVSENKIVNISPSINNSAKQIFDCNGLALAPGFIDVQNHSDTYWQIFENPNLDSQTAQGYTTIIVGNSGSSLAPLLSKESIKSVQKWRSTNGLNVNWQSFEQYVSVLKNLTFGTNIASLTGYSTVRRGVLGDNIEVPSKADLDMVCKVIADTFQQGSVGLSVGLQYSHELNVTDAELMRIAEVCAQYNKVLSVSLRDELRDIPSQVTALIAIAEQSQVLLKISHLKFRHTLDENIIKETLEIIEHAWHRGVKVYFDSYPYTSVWQPLYTYLPTWSLIGGRTSLIERLQDKLQRSKILDHLISQGYDLANLIISATDNSFGAFGKTISSIAANFGLTSEETILKIIEHGGSSTLVFDNCLSEKSVELINNHPLGFIATNGAGFSKNYSGMLLHPRCFGSAPKFLRKVVDSKIISLEEAVRKLTMAPAGLYNLKDRGQIKVGAIADAVLFNPKIIDSSATLINSQVYPVGISSVMVDGNIVWQDGAFVSEANFGKYLY